MKKSEQDSTVSTVNKGGRPTLYTPETIDRLLAGLADGLSIKQACLACGISDRTLTDWRERYPDLEPRLAEAREQARQNALACIKSAGQAGDWRAAEAFLRLSFHQDYRRDSNISLSATANVGQALVCDEETRSRLIALNQKLLSGSSETKQLHSLPAIEVNEIEGVLADTPNMENTNAVQTNSI